MTVAELIALLEQEDPDMEVVDCVWQDPIVRVVRFSDAILGLEVNP